MAKLESKLWSCQESAKGCTAQSDGVGAFWWGFSNIKDLEMDTCGMCAKIPMGYTMRSLTTKGEIKALT